MITEIVYNNRDNIISIELRSDGTAEAINTASRMTLLIRDKLIDSNLVSGVFDWTTNGASGQLDLVLGHQGLKTGKARATLTVYDNTYPNGLCWGDFMLDVRG